MNNQLEQKQILVVDDEPDIGLLMRMMLNSAGYRVKHVQNLTNAKEAIDDTAFDTIFLDLNLDGEFGLDLVPYIKSHCEETVIAVITAQKAPEIRKEVKSSGVNILIEKPFNKEKILNVLK